MGIDVVRFVGPGRVKRKGVYTVPVYTVVTVGDKETTPGQRSQGTMRDVSLSHIARQI